MIFKIGFFVFLCGIVCPLFSGADFILWDSKHKEALRQYRVHKAEGKPLSLEMTSAYQFYLEIRVWGAVAAVGLLLMLVGFIFGDIK
jgi:hypothetical protein